MQSQRYLSDAICYFSKAEMFSTMLQVTSWVYPMAQYLIPYGGGPSMLPRNITSWLFQEFKNSKTSYWTEQRASELPTLVGRCPSAL